MTRRAHPAGAVQDVTPHEAVAGDAELESELGTVVGDGSNTPPAAYGPPFQGPPPHLAGPQYGGEQRESDGSRIARLRDKYPSRPGAPIPHGLRTAEERQRISTRVDVSEPPKLYIAPPTPQMAPFVAQGVARSLEEALKQAAKLAIDEDEDEAGDMIRAILADLRKRRHQAQVETRARFEADLESTREVRNG